MISAAFPGGHKRNVKGGEQECPPYTTIVVTLGLCLIPGISLDSGTHISKARDMGHPM
jgi:hypothetical protein